jgi:DNA modification methylase
LGALRLEYWWPSELDDNPENWRRHPAGQAEGLDAVLDEVGWAGAALYNEATGRLIDGHLRKKRAIERGEQVPVLVGSWTEEQERLILSTLDPLAAMAEVAGQSLKDLIDVVEPDAPEGTEEIFERLKAEAEEALAAMIAEDAPDDPGAQVDKAEELREKWQVEAGQLWQLGDHRLICGDCTDAAVVERVMGGEKAQLMVTDPPYGVSYASKNEFLNSIDKGNRVQSAIENDHQSKEETQALWKAAFERAGAIMDRGAVIYCFMPQGGDQMMMMMMMMMMNAGIEPRHELIWLKNNHVLGRVDYAYKHEPILYAWKDGGHKFYGDFQTSILQFDKPTSSKLHPTMKPVELVELLVNNSSRNSEVVYDPFVGSGTTLIACERLGRRCRAVEIEPKYVAVTLERWHEMTGEEPVLVESQASFAADAPDQHSNAGRGTEGGVEVTEDDAEGNHQDAGND